MAGSLSISITADVADVRAKLALAQADLRAFNSETRRLADEMRAAGESGSSTLGAGLQTAAQRAAQAKAEVASLNAELRASATASASGGIGALGQGFERLGGIIGAARTAIEGFLAAAAVERFAGAIEGSLKLGEELEILSQKTRIPTTGLSDLKFAADQNNVSFETLTQALRGLAVTTEEAISKPAGRAAAGYQQLGISTEFLRANQNDLMAILARVADAYATGGTAAQQADNAQIIFLRGGRELIPVLQLGSAGLKAMADRARELGVEFSPSMVSKLAEAEKASKELSAAWTGLEAQVSTKLAPTLTNLFHVMAEGTAGNFKAALVTDYRYELAGLTADLSSLQAKAAQDSGLAKWWDTQKIKGLEFQIDIVKGKLADLASSESIIGKTIPLPPVSGAGGAAAVQSEESPKAKSPWKDLVDGTTQASALAKFREGLAEMRAAWDGTNVGMLAQEVQMWAGEVNDAKLNAKEKVEAEKGYADAVRALRLAQRAENEAIARSNADSDIAVAKLRIGAERDTLAAEFQAHEINADQRRALLQNLLNEEFDLNLAELHREEALLQQQPAELARVLNQEKILKAQNAQDMAAIDRQYTADLKRENEEQVRSWRTAIGEIDSAESSLFNDILTKRQKLSVSVAQIIDREIAQELTADARYLTQKLLYNALGLADDQKNATGGLLVHLLAENTKTVATTTGAARRRLAESTEGTNLITQIAQMVGRWVGMEAAKTGATTTGAGEREAVFTAEQLAGQAAAVAAGFSQIQIDAAVAAAGAFAATAPIPYVGPILAPEAAAAAYAETIGWAAGLGGGVAGLDVGAWSVKSSGLAFVHAGEQVQPAVPGPNFNQGMAAALAGGGDNYAINFTIQANDTRTGAAFLKNQAGTIAQIIAQGVRNANARYSTAARG